MKVEKLLTNQHVFAALLQQTDPPYSPTPVRVPTVSGAAGVKANSLQLERSQFTDKAPQEAARAAQITLAGDRSFTGASA